MTAKTFTAGCFTQQHWSDYLLKNCCSKTQVIEAQKLKYTMSLLISMRFVGQTHIGDQHILSSIDHCTVLNVRHYFLKHLWHPVPNCCQIESKIHLILVSKIAIQIKTYDYDLIKLVPFSWTNEHRKSLGRIVCLVRTH